MRRKKPCLFPVWFLLSLLRHFLPSQLRRSPVDHPWSSSPEHAWIKDHAYLLCVVASSYARLRPDEKKRVDTRIDTYQRATKNPPCFIEGFGKNFRLRFYSTKLPLLAYGGQSPKGGNRSSNLTLESSIREQSRPCQGGAKKDLTKTKTTLLWT